MEIVVEHKECDQCGTCIGVCPTDALMLVDRLQVDHERCTRCMTCVKVCPFAALSCTQAH